MGHIPYSVLILQPNIFEVKGWPLHKQKPGMMGSMNLSKTLFNRTFILAFTCGDLDGLG